MRSPEVVFLSTFAVVSLFALYSVGRSYSESHGLLLQARALQALEGQDIEASIAILLVKGKLTRPVSKSTQSFWCE